MHHSQIHIFLIEVLFVFFFFQEKLRKMLKIFGNQKSGKHTSVCENLTLVFENLGKFSSDAVSDE